MHDLLQTAESVGDLFAEDAGVDRDGMPRRREGDVEALLAHLKGRHGDRIVAVRSVPARPGRFAPLPGELDARIVGALGRAGITRLYSHQRAAWDAARAGRDVVVVTPTASGKTLCYNLPVIQSRIEQGTKALYLFPTKALAQDQLAALLALESAAGLGMRAFTFDGDTPADARKAVRLAGDIVVTNPDMLHQGILPQHTKWAQFFERLRYVVIDELHTYRGVFGAHVANLLRRLERVAAFYGVRPTYLLCSATIANPGELAARLIGRPVEVIGESGAPSGAKHLVIWNPPVVNAGLGLRASARSQSALIARAACQLGLKTIVFANSRLEVEVLTKYLKDVFDRDRRQGPRVAAYRGGYLPSERRTQERRLREGTLDCVVSTSALELGVDIGGLDVCVLNGYPGTIAGALQRLGRAGRRGRTALGVLVATSDLLDQYLARHPEFFLDASPEHAHADPEQLLIQMDHVRCAAFELPFRAGDRFGREALAEQLDYLREHGLVHAADSSWHWIADSYPAQAVSLRSVAEGNFVVVDVTDGRQDILAEVDYASAALTLYEGAIYLIQASPWQVERLDWAGRKAFVRKTGVDYYTDAIDFTKLKVLDPFESAGAGEGIAAHGEVHVVRRVTGYKKIRYYTHENVGYGHVRLPDSEMHTSSVWWTLPADALDRAFVCDRAAALEGFLGAAHVLHRVAALVAMADARDIGWSVGDGDGAWSLVAEAGTAPTIRMEGGNALDPARAAPFRPTLFLFDNYAGGIGLAAPLYDARCEIVARAIDLVEDCPCAHGCPACVGPVLNRETRVLAPRITPKRAALQVLSMLSSADVAIV